MDITVNYQWNGGLIFGLTADSIHMVEEDKEPDFNSETRPIIYLYLGIITLYFIF